MSLNRRLSRWDANQSRLEDLDGRGHNDISRQLVPNPNSSREETVVEGIDTPSWNTELTTLSSHITVMPLYLVLRPVH